MPATTLMKTKSAPLVVNVVPQRGLIWGLLLRPGGRRWKLLWLTLAVHCFRVVFARRRCFDEAVPRPLCQRPERPLVAFSGAGLMWAYYHGIVTYIRDHFNVDNLQLSAISGGCMASLGLVMGLDLYQIVVLGLTMRKRVLSNEGCYMFSCSKLVSLFRESMDMIGLTDWDVQRVAERQQLFIGVTQCFPPRHVCVPAPSTVNELLSLWVCSMCVPPFLSTPGSFHGKFYIDGGFSAVWSVPEDRSFEDVLKVTCVPPWCTLCSPAMTTADVQPSELMLSTIFYPYSWKHQRKVLKLGYDDAHMQHHVFVKHGLRELPGAPLTPWSAWETLFDALDEDNLPPLNSTRVTSAVSKLEESHDELLRTHSASDLVALLKRRRSFRAPALGRCSSGG